MTTLNEVQPLTPAETGRLRELEVTILQGLTTFRETGSALAEIRDGRLYRATYSTFDAYLTERWGISRQHAGRLIQAAEVAQVLSPTGYTPDTEREARTSEAKAAAQVVQQLAPEQQQQVARFIQATTGTAKPTTSQIKAVAEVVQAIDEHGTVAHPETGEPVPFMELPEPARMAVIRENVSTGTHERLQRQKGHVQGSVMQAKSNGRGGWTDWCLSYAEQQLTGTQELRLVIKRDASGNATVQALVVDTESHATVAYGDHAPYLKKAVMNLVEEVKA
ncbi:hypothetical protein [Deinococcus sedimenti]|uniref:Uncharacterized protein n=1 Tax=Deinococcus sedimenti TaxID=1867090 RepID=A0ABQ2SB14_9DEIO|nr:hypothetical protein [Deinococcus sedimenti]GGS06769.1 hypothetical protein GCM10008960_36460 [Deinococcus sedimenti]